MARMYSRKKGRSGSTKPSVLKAPWVKYKTEEVEEIVIKLAKQGKQSAQIGLILRDQYGLPTVKINKLKLYSMIKKHSLQPDLPEDLFNLLKKSVKLHHHMSSNRKDSTSKRGLELTESKIRRLVKFHIKNKTLPEGWKYNLEQAKLLVK